MQRQEILEHVRQINAVVGLGGAMESAEVGPAIARSWNRCVHDFGLDPARDEPVIVLDNRELKERREPLERLCAIAQGEMATLYQQLAGSGFSVLLTDHEGVVLDFLGDPSFTETAANAACGPAPSGASGTRARTAWGPARSNSGPSWFTTTSISSRATSA